MLRDVREIFFSCFLVCVLAAVGVGMMILHGHLISQSWSLFN